MRCIVRHLPWQWSRRDDRIRRHRLYARKHENRAWRRRSIKNRRNWMIARGISRRERCSWQLGSCRHCRWNRRTPIHLHRVYTPMCVMIRAVTNHEWPPVMSILLYYYDSLWANDMVNRLSFLNDASTSVIWNLIA